MRVSLLCFSLTRKKVLNPSNKCFSDRKLFGRILNIIKLNYRKRGNYNKFLLANSYQINNVVNHLQSYERKKKKKFTENKNH